MDDAHRFSPPTPLAQVACKNPETGAIWADMPMLVDTGADVSLLPQAILKRVDLTPVPGRATS